MMILPRVASPLLVHAAAEVAGRTRPTFSTDTVEKLGLVAAGRSGGGRTALRARAPGRSVSARRLAHDVYRAVAQRCIIRSVNSPAIKRTNINLDTQLLNAAAAVLGTERTTDTVHAALRTVVDRAARERLARRDFADLTPDLLARIRQPRRQS
jgi:Arc/MetJ family transcription regulator